MVSLWTVVGVTAAALTSTSFLPQLILRLRKPGQARLSYGTLTTFMTGSVLWTAYGVHLRDVIIIGANVFIFSNLAALAWLQWRAEKKPHTHHSPQPPQTDQIFRA